MSLDATVYCDCMERGLLRAEPLAEWSVYVDASGARFPASQRMEDAMAFDRWNVDACVHDNGVLLHHYLGNISWVGLIRATLSNHQERFSMILTRVVCDGVHCGDHLLADQLPQLTDEVEALSSVHPNKPAAEECIRDFEKKMRELLAAAKAVGKPISF